MKAALIREVGAAPEPGEADEPSGETIEVLAAPINPIDLSVSRGVLATGHPELPYVPGCEGVGRTADGKVVWIFGGSLGRTSHGAMAERAPIGDAHAIEVPDGADPALAGALGIAGLAGWLPFAWRAPLKGGENVLVLGATGSVGIVAVQTAKLLGAGRVVAAGSQRRVRSSAPSSTEPTRRSASTSRDLVAVFKNAFGGEGPSYVFDPLWGAPAAAAAEAAVPWATIVNLGQSAGATSELASAAVRFKSLSILGHTNFTVPLDELAEHYRRLVGHAIAGEIRIDVERVPLDAVCRCLAPSGRRRRYEARRRAVSARGYVHGFAVISKTMKSRMMMSIRVTSRMRLISCCASGSAGPRVSIAVVSLLTVGRIQKTPVMNVKAHPARAMRTHQKSHCHGLASFVISPIPNRRTSSDAGA